MGSFFGLGGSGGKGKDDALPPLPLGLADDGSQGHSTSTSKSPSLTPGAAAAASGQLRNRVVSPRTPSVQPAQKNTTQQQPSDEERTPKASTSGAAAIDKRSYPTRSRTRNWLGTSSPSSKAGVVPAGAGSDSLHLASSRDELHTTGGSSAAAAATDGGLTRSISKPTGLLGTGFDARGYPARSPNSASTSPLLVGSASSTPKLGGLGMLPAQPSAAGSLSGPQRPLPNPPPSQQQVGATAGPSHKKGRKAPGGGFSITSRSQSYHPPPQTGDSDDDDLAANATPQLSRQAAAASRGLTSYPPTSASHSRNPSEDGVDLGLGYGGYGGGGGPSRESSAPSYRTYDEPQTTNRRSVDGGYYDNPYASTSTDIGAGGGGGGHSSSRPPSVYSGATHSPAVSFGSDAAFGAAAGWGQGPRRERGGNHRSRGSESDGHEYLDDEASVESYDTDGSGFYRSGKGMASMQQKWNQSFASLDSRLTMGREVNVPGWEGLGGRYSLPVDLSLYAALGPEADDELHDPLLASSKQSKGRGKPSWRGFFNIGCVSILLTALVTLFAGYPIISYYSTHHQTTKGAYNIGGINATGQIPSTMGNFGLIDADTPSSAYTKRSLETGTDWQLVFSDEFNVDGRTFYPGDDPYWEAADLHYWQTNNLEWYDPRAVTTKDGALQITLSNIETHGLNYEGGMIMSWNKFCFTGGYLEVNVSLPGTSDVYGLWPAVWTLGNLGRAGYGGSLEGLWPYSYNECDVGTLPNQTLNGLPASSLTDGDPQFNNALSYLTGQRLSRCTCPNDPTHPGPKNPDGTFVGRSAPEIDVFEATVDAGTRIGKVSQSAQWAPFNAHYYFVNDSSTYTIYDDATTELNSYQGGALQQATSGISITDQKCYTQDSGCFSLYGFEYAPGADGYITWVNDARKAWTIRGAAMGPNAEAEVGQRDVPKEPMYIIINLGLSENFGAVDYIDLYKQWPVT